MIKKFNEFSNINENLSLIDLFNSEVNVYKTIITNDYKVLSDSYKTLSVENLHTVVFDMLKKYKNDLSIYNKIPSYRAVVEEAYDDGNEIILDGYLTLEKMYENMIDVLEESEKELLNIDDIFTIFKTY